MTIKVSLLKWRTEMAYLGYQFVDDVVVPTLVQLDAAVMVALDVRPRLAVDAVHTDEAYLPTVDIAREYAHHVEVLVVVETSVLRREDEHGVALVAVCLVFHVTPEGGRVFLHVIDIHFFKCTNSTNSLTSSMLSRRTVYICCPMAAENSSGMRSHITMRSP